MALGPIHHAVTHISTLHRFGGYVEITALAPSRKPIKRYFTDHDIAAEWALDVNWRGYSVFVGVNPRWRFSGHEESIASVVALPLDFDPGKHDDPTSALHMLCSVGIAPSLVLRSGNGTHAYLLLSSPTDPPTAKLTAERLCRATNSDHVHNTNRIMRLAGSLNWKNNQDPKWSFITGLSPERQYTLSDVELALDRLGVARLEVKTYLDIRHPQSVVDSIKELVMKCPPHAYDLIHSAEKVSQAQATRSETDYYVESELVLQDATDDQIRCIYQSDEYAIGKLKYCEAGDHYLNRTIERARLMNAEPVERRKAGRASDMKAHRPSRGSSSEKRHY